MAGVQAGFNAADFRSKIRFVSTMAAPTASADRPTFYFQVHASYDRPVDSEEVPFDPTASRLPSGASAPVQVPAVMEYYDALGDEVAFGTVTPSRVAVTLLDEDYARVKGATSVMIGGERYLYRHTEIPRALFDVGLYRTWWVAENEL